MIGQLASELDADEVRVRDILARTALLPMRQTTKARSLSEATHSSIGRHFPDPSDVNNKSGIVTPMPDKHHGYPANCFTKMSSRS